MKKTLFVLSGVTALLLSMTPVAQAHGGILRLDADGDGKISREEFQPPKDRGGPRILQRADADGDGQLTRDEMLAAVGDIQERQARMPEMFDAMDTDGNGVVTQAEAQDHAFARIDANADGFISEDEARAMRNKRDERPKRWGRQNIDQP